jgi:hypothetical protein
MVERKSFVSKNEWSAHYHFPKAWAKYRLLIPVSALAAWVVSWSGAFSLTLSLTEAELNLIKWLLAGNLAIAVLCYLVRGWNGVLVGVLSGLLYGVLVGLLFSLLVGLLFSLLVGVLVGVLYGLLYGFED